ncbi:hypothetical protein [Microbaculum marinum]|uniref:Uncharacterized protein n=1 Tax=Microbaculum marinum TaxID=1764581 RepID=A0AAW9RS15_9HYPH
MTNPILIGGLMIGGAFAGWRMMRERGRVRRMFEKLSRESAKAPTGDVVRLERDPETGIYGPAKER